MIKRKEGHKKREIFMLLSVFKVSFCASYTLIIFLVPSLTLLIDCRRSQLHLCAVDPVCCDDVNCVLVAQRDDQ